MSHVQNVHNVQPKCNRTAFNKGHFDINNNINNFDHFKALVHVQKRIPTHDV